MITWIAYFKFLAVFARDNQALRDNLIYVITTDAAAQSEGYGRYLKWIGYSDCCEPKNPRIKISL